MEKITGNEPMHPVVIPGFVEPSVKGGLTIRQHFAAMAMQGLLANDWSDYRRNDEDCVNLSKAAVNYADALISELNKP